MNITVVGTGYVGLVTGVSLSDIGHNVTCLDIDKEKVNRMRKGISPIYEPGLEDLMKKNTEQGRLRFTSDHHKGFAKSEIIYIAVGTPQKEDGTADLRYIEEVAKDIARNVKHNVIVVTKSTVPVGTNGYVKQIIQSHLVEDVIVDIASNPEFLREGSAVHDTFNGDRIVIGTENEKVASVIEEVNKPFGIPVFKTDILSAEMIKYASNAFLATKISFINEISNICEKLGANIEEVAQGMGLDNRIGTQFLKAGIGYGGSCFPKDTNALVQIAGNVEHNFELLKSVIKVNNDQQVALVKKARDSYGSLEGKRIALLGLAFKPNTDDMREAASIVVSEQLINEGATVVGYDPIAIENAKRVLHQDVTYVCSIEEALKEADFAFVLTEWDIIRQFDLHEMKKLMKEPVLFDGRNCFSLNQMAEGGFDYHSMGRPAILRKNVGIKLTK